MILVKCEWRAYIERLRTLRVDRFGKLFFTLAHECIIRNLVVEQGEYTHIHTHTDTDTTKKHRHKQTTHT
jgi:hypothetical protein